MFALVLDLDVESSSSLSTFSAPPLCSREASMIPDVVVSSSIDARAYDVNVTLRVPAATVAASSSPSSSSSSVAPASWCSSGAEGDAWIASLFRDFGAARDQILSIADAVESGSMAMPSPVVAPPRTADLGTWLSFCFGETLMSAASQKAHPGGGRAGGGGGPSNLSRRGGATAASMVRSTASFSPPLHPDVASAAAAGDVFDLQSPTPAAGDDSSAGASKAECKQMPPGAAGGEGRLDAKRSAEKSREDEDAFSSSDEEVVASAVAAAAARKGAGSNGSARRSRVVGAYGSLDEIAALPPPDAKRPRPIVADGVSWGGAAAREASAEAPPPSKKGENNTARDCEASPPSSSSSSQLLFGTAGSAASSAAPAEAGEESTSSRKDADGTPPWTSTLVALSQLDAERVLRRLCAHFDRRFQARHGATQQQEGATAAADSNTMGSVAASGEALSSAPPHATKQATSGVASFCMRPSECAWLYALLSRLATPLHADTASTLRSLFLLARAQLVSLCPPRGAGGALEAASIRVIALIAGDVFKQSLPGE